MNDSLIKKTNEINTDSIFKNHPNVLYAYSDSIIIKPYVEQKHTYKIKASDTLSLQENRRSLVCKWWVAVIIQSLIHTWSSLCLDGPSDCCC